MVLALKEEAIPRGEIIELFPKKAKDLSCSIKTSTGRKKASAADSIRSLDDIKKIQNYFLSNGRIRDYMMFTVGVCTGLRISDVCRLRLSDLLNEDGSFKEYIYMVEKKTGKLSSNIDDKCLITEAVREAVTLYLDYKKEYDINEPLVYSRKGGDTEHFLDPKSGWRILNEAGIKLDLQYHLSSHSMRKTFANIAACMGGAVNINMPKLLSVQHMLKHSDYKTTMRYLGLTSFFTEQARKDVSDFVLGKTDKNILYDALIEEKDKEDSKLDMVLEAINKLIDATEDE